MRYAIGLPGRAARMVFETNDPAIADQQKAAGEIKVATDIVGPIYIGGDRKAYARTPAALVLPADPSPAADGTIAVAGIPAGTTISVNRGPELTPDANGMVRVPVVAGGEYVIVAFGRAFGSAVLRPVDVATFRAQQAAKVDDQREAAQMAVLTAGGAKKLVYAEKANEVRDYRSLLASVVSALSLVDRRKRWPFAMAEVDLTGDTLAAVMARFEAGLSTSRSEIARIEAIAQLAKRQMRSATTAAAIAAAAIVKWGS